MQPPLFILSPPRSFTTVTCAMLGNHPEMFGLAETNLFLAETVGELARLHRLRPRVSHGLLRSIAELGFAEQSVETIAAAKAWLADNAEMSTIEMFGLLAEWAAPRTVIEKSPSHVYKAEALARMRQGFPDAYYLHLTRHPAAMWGSTRELREQILEATGAAGGRAAWGHGTIVKEGELDPERLWLKPHLTILEFLEDIPADRQLRLRGEDLLENPPLYLPQICEWLGKRHDKEAIEAMLHPEASPFAKYGPPNAKFGNDPKFMESPQLRPYTSAPRPLDGVEVNGEFVAFSPAFIHYAELFGY